MDPDLGLGEGMVKITEGKASTLFSSSNEVFYNPVQEFNRDLSIAVIKKYTDKLWNPDRSKKKQRRQCKQKEKATNSGIVTESGEGRDGEGEGGARARDGEESEGGGAGDGDGGESEGGGAGDGDGGKSEGGGAGDEREEKGRNETAMETAETPQESPENGLQILEALAASGLRSIRYALEIPNVKSIIANDFSEKAYQSIIKNVKHNGLEGKVVPSWREASILMYEHREPFTRRFDVIDLDPYGSPSQFLDSAIQSVRDGGLLCVTCTDMSVLCGTHSESCHSKYGSMSVKSKFCHEMALRIVLASLESHANRYRRYIVPLLSCSVDFYIRLFVCVFTSPQEVKRAPSKLSMVYHCIGCESFYFQAIGKRIEEGKSKKYPPGTGPPVGRQCDQCSSIFRLGGPIWTEPIHNSDFVLELLKEIEACPSEMYKTKSRIKGLLTVVSEEIPDAPLYHVLDSVCSTLHCDTPKMLSIRSAILDQGYRVSLSHANPNAIKTDAPQEVFWDIMRCWIKISSTKKPGPNSPAAGILSKEPKIQACFDIRKDANPPSRLLKLARFPENPEANWGPKARAKRKGSDMDEDMVTKRLRLQGKRN